ncbi:unnamed protein product, partial [Musa acuminata subsp. burmannicoides]
MEQAPGAPGGTGEGPSSSSDPADPGAASPPPPLPPRQEQQQQQPPLSRYESQKRRDWNTFLQYLTNHKPPLTLARCSGAHVIEFLKYLDQFGKTKVHAAGCTFFGQPNPPAPCACPLRQAWGSLDALIGRLRAAYEESGGRSESNPFAARPVRIYLRRCGRARPRPGASLTRRSVSETRLRPPLPRHPLPPLQYPRRIRKLGSLPLRLRLLPVGLVVLLFQRWAFDGMVHHRP